MSPKQNRSKAVHKSEPYYTNEDVAILHSIVTRAEELLSVLPERERIPTNALFHAYYAILPKIGLDADHDNRYARVLFKIGGRRGEGALYEKFENVLAQMGIDIQFDYIDENEANRSREERDSSTLHSGTNAHATVGNSTAFDRQRRNSETAAWPVGLERIEQPSNRARSSSPHSALQTPARKSQLPDSELPIRQRGGIEECQTSEQRSKEIESWMSSRQQESKQHHSREPRKFDYLNPVAPHEIEYVDDAAQTAMDSYAVELDADQRYRQSMLDQSLYYKREPSELDDWTGETDEFNIQRVRSRHDKALLRRFMSEWHQKASWQRHNFSQLWDEAVTKDRIMLLRPAFDTWRSRVLHIQQEREEKRIQIEQEEEAAHARETYLAHKYFTRWVSVCSEEQEKIEAARQRILALRLFNTWRDHTAEIQLKTRFLLQRRFLNKWRSKQAHNAHAERLSTRAYEIKLAKRVFWGWFWGFCESRAPSFWQENIKKKHLEAWRWQNSILGINFMIAQQSHNIRVQLPIIQAWKERTSANKGLEIVAAEQYRRKRCEQVMRAWNKQHHLVEVKQEADRKIGNMLAKSMLGRWRLHTKQGREAAAYNKLRILKDTLLIWRLQTKAKQLEEHRLHQAFHTWRLVVAGKKANRIFRQRLLHKFMPRLVKTTRQAVVTTEFLTTHAEDVHSHYLARTVLRKWRERLAAVTALPQRAANMRSAPIIAECLEKWVEKKRKNDQMEKWAADAEFYLIGDKALRKWRKASEDSKKERRKMAYAQARRQNKLNLAKLTLDKWRVQTAEVRAFDMVAGEVRMNKTVALAINALEVWKSKSHDIGELNEFASFSRQRKTLSQWKVRLAQVGRDMAIAEESDIIRLRARSLKKWSREALQYRAHEHLVSELRDKRAKRSLRLAFKHWRSTLDVRQNAGLLFNGRATVSPRPAATIPAFTSSRAANRQVETLINFEESVFQSPEKPHIKDMSPMKSTPLPAYLNTPSRRSTLTRSVLGPGPGAVSTTPAGTPAPLFGRSTPFAKSLRGGNPLSAYTRRTATRPLSKLRAFDDLVEEAKDDVEMEM